MNQDFRKIPYNIWICILSLIILVVISGLGIKIVLIADTLEPEFIIEGYDDFINDIEPVCQKDTNCSTENIDIKMFAGYKEISIDKPEKYNFHFIHYESVYNDLNESKDMLNIKYEKSFNMKVVVFILLIVGAFFVSVGVVCAIFFFTHYIWLDKPIVKTKKKKGGKLK